MNIQIRLNDCSARGVPKAVISVFLLLVISSASLTGQAPPEQGDLYGGIELSAEGAKAIVLRISRSKEEPGLKLLYSEIVYLALGRTSSGEFAPQASAEAARAVQKLLARLQQYQVPSERIFLIGSSSLLTDRPKDLVSAISETTGKTPIFLDAETEVQLAIVGTIPQRERAGDAWIDIRNSSALIEFGSDSIRGGYQLLRYSPSAKYDFVTMNIPYGTASFANEITRAVMGVNNLTVFAQRAEILGAGAIREALRKEIERKPGLVNRRRVYITGGIAWALATMLYPEDRQTFIPLNQADIALFAREAARAPRAVLKSTLSRNRSREFPQEVEWELEAVRNTFTPQQLIAGAEVIKAVSTEFNWQEKTIWFARFGNLSCILSYVRLQAEK